MWNDRNPSRVPLNGGCRKKPIPFATKPKTKKAINIKYVIILSYKWSLGFKIFHRKNIIKHGRQIQ